MVCEFKEEIIRFNDKDVHFSCDQFPAEKAIILKFKLIKIFGSCIGELASLANKKQDENMLKKLFEVIGEVFEKNKPEDVLALIKEFVIGANMDSNKIQAHDINMKFGGDNMMLLYRLFIFVIKSNYSNFIQTAISQKAV